ncbi:MAG: FHA domain-containing protein [Verrucomicrobiaceae bacterium]|nr:FHA domain-containing protein [Verrucomicrobiaceae bacterium]
MNSPVLVRRLTGMQKGKDEHLQTQELSFGTGANNTIRFDPTWDRGVGTSHARIWCDERGAWWLKDTGSSTGTFINGQRITMQRQVGGSFVMELGQGGPKVEITLPGEMPRGAAAPGVRPGAARGASGGGMKWLALAACAALLGAGAWFFMKNGGNIGVTSIGPGEAPESGAAGEGNGPWTPQVDMGGQIFPSYLVAIATMNQAELPNARVPHRLGDPGGIMCVKVTSPADKAKIRVRVDANSVIKGGGIEVELPKKGETYRVYPKVDYLYEALLKVRQAIPLTLTMRVALDGVEESRALTVRLCSINDCPFVVRDDASPDGQGAALCSWMFAAYVNENHPYSEEIRKEALKSGTITAFDGYQSGEPGVVLNQVFSIWNVLQQRGVRYSNVTTTSGNNEDVMAQQVRFVDQTINSSQANCVDGSVIFASILRQIGIEPVLVLVPGHMFAGFYLKEGDPGSLAFLETTLMGKTDLSQIGSLKGLPPPVQSGVEAIRGKAMSDAQMSASAQSFIGALDAGMKQFVKHKPAIDKGQGMAGLVEIQDARKRGVMPIAYQP